jgi:tetratricopeptide (TPR) repeat protein
MHLRTFGGLVLHGAKTRREKPLLLLAYLALEGSRPRRTLAELFWPDASNPMNSLAVAIKQLRAFGAIEADEARAWTDVSCDANLFLELVRQRQLDQALVAYTGIFCDGVMLDDAGADLNEWVYATRERLAHAARTVLLELGERAAAAGQFDQASQHAEQAVQVVAAPPLEAAQLVRLHRLLMTTTHPLRDTLEQDAEEIGVSLSASPEVARRHLRQQLIGRNNLLETCLGLPEGQWLYVRGGPGMGKTSVLQALEARGFGRYLPARADLPFATLEPVLSDLDGGEGVIARRLANQGQNLIVDDWDLIDTASQGALRKLLELRSEVRVVLGGTNESALGLQTVTLDSLPESDLTDHPGAFVATDGIPSLVGAWLRNEPTDQALESQLNRLSRSERRVYLALALLEEPDLARVRTALGLPGSETINAFETLHEAGLLEPSGVVRAKRGALTHLDANLRLNMELSIALARTLEGVAALPLYRRSRALWEDSDTPAVQEAYLLWAKESLRRGYPAGVAETLEEAPVGADVLYMRAQALERSGESLQSLKVTERVLEMALTEELRAMVFALQSALLWTLGRADDARNAAEQALKGDETARAEAHNTLGKLAFAIGKPEDSEAHFGRAATLWAVIGDRARRVDALNNRAIARSQHSGHDDQAFAEALEAAEGLPANRARVLMNMGNGLNRAKRFKEAINVTKQALDDANSVGLSQITMISLYNLGTIYEHIKQFREARSAFEECMLFARALGDRRVIGLSMVQISRIEKNPPGLLEGYEYLEKAGFGDLVDEIRHN